MKFSYLSLGGGVQSSVIAEMIAEGDLPPVDVVLFADTGDDPDYVYGQVEYLRKRLDAVGVPLEIVNNGNLVEDMLSGNSRQGKFAFIPAHSIVNEKKRILKRQCTQEYKIVPVERRARHILLERGWARENKAGAVYLDKDVEIKVLLGITLDEAQRMKPNRHKQFTNIFPLIDRKMTRYDCALWLEKRGLPVPKKSSCRICPYHDDVYWRWMRDESPNDWEHCVRVDKHLRSDNGGFAATAKGELYLHRSCVPLDEVDLSTPQDSGQTEMFDK